MNEQVHIVCLDAPAPPDYGGAIDMYYKIIALHAIGKKISLHYFKYSIGRSADSLAPYCKEIFSYERKKGLSAMSLRLPYIVSSRINKQLIDRLNKDDAPIILEGIHCTGIVSYLKNKSRNIVVRIHNDEALYYKRLANAEKNINRKLYFNLESLLLHSYQKKIPSDFTYACLSTLDLSTFIDSYKLTSSVFIPCFVAWETINAKESNGDYCLYHGNMSVSENEEAAAWLIKNVFSKVHLPFIIAGKGISNYLKTLCKKYPHIKLVTDPTIHEINDLVKNAQINVLPSVNNTGVKLKLLHALFCGRSCITNTQGVQGSNLEKAVHKANNPLEWILLIEQLMKTDFSKEDILQRQIELKLYNNIENAKRLNAHLQ